MPTGADIARAALRRIGALDPTEDGEAEDIVAVLDLASDMLDAWATDHLTISGTLRSPYDLVINTQSYTIGSGGVFDQQYPSAIDKWSVIPDDDAAHPQEIPRGRPLTMLEWQYVLQKTQTGPYPTRLVFDERQASGLGRILVHPIPDNNDVDIVLYQRVPAVVTLVQATNYTFPRAGLRAVKDGIARELALDGSHEVPIDLVQLLVKRADESKAALERQNYVPRETPIRRSWSRVGRRGRFNIQTG